MSELVGKQIDNYRVEALLGAGGMGTVYRAHDLSLDRKVALKVMNRDLARRPQFQQRFLQEAQTAARLKHPAIATVYYFGSSQDNLYMASEFVPGGTLGQYIEQWQQVGQIGRLSETLHLVAQVAEALGYAHQHGVVHRDVKPDNVLLTAEEPTGASASALRAVVTDFGLAKLLEGGMQTQPGTFLGTMHYMSPEQCMGHKLDGRSDIYSLGIMLYQLATGYLPFAIKTPAEAAEKHIRVNPPTPRSRRPGLPETVEVIITKAIAKEANDRYQTAEEMAQALWETASGLTIEEETQVAPPSATVSLLTQVLSTVQPISPPSLDPNLVASMDVDQVIIQHQGEAPRQHPLDKSPLTVGRSRINDIILDADGVSRQHARIERRAGGWHLLDVGSSNGTFLDDHKLLPDIPELWKTGQVARIGPCFLRWQPAATMIQSAIHSHQATIPIGGTRIYSSSGQVSVVLNPTNPSVLPGEQIDVQVELFNQWSIVDHFSLRVEDLPPSWLKIPQEQVRLFPGTPASLTFGIHPPAHSQAKAGSYPFRVVITSTSNLEETAVVSGNLTVKPFTLFALKLDPIELEKPGLCHLLIRNQGNDNHTYTIRAGDRANVLQFRQLPTQVTIAAGKDERLNLLVLPRQRPLLGRNQQRQFTVQVEPRAGKVKEVQGQVSVPPIIPPWAVTLSGLLLLFLCAVGTYAFNYVTGLNATATADWVAAVTETAVSIAAQGAMTSAEQTRQAEIVQMTATAEQDANATATSLALTVMAQGDDDGDGLSNEQEITLGTDPQNPDTDGDGLTDGEEVNRYNTEPNNIDTDADGAKDGIEVNEMGTSPKNPDSDNDGVLDGSDQDPLATSTPILTDTPNPTATTVPSATSTNAPTATSAPTNTPTPMPPTATPTPELFVRALVAIVDGNIIPDLATEWELNDDGTQLTFRLVGNVQMEDGRVFTASEAKEALEAWPPFSTGSISFETVDDLSLGVNSLNPLNPTIFLEEISKVKFVTR